MQPDLQGASGAAAGIAVTGLAQAWKVVVSIGSAIILARLLSPEDFGLMAMLAPSIALTGLFQDLGLHQTIIQRRSLSHGQTSGLFWISLSVSALIATLLAFTAPLQVRFYGETRLFELTVAFSVLIVVWNIQSIHSALLTRAMRFRVLSMIDVTSVTIGFAVGASTAFATASYWSLYVGALAAGLMAAVMSWSASGFRPIRVAFEGEMFNMIKFGSSVSAAQFFNFVMRNADLLLIGRFHGAVELGQYERAYKLLLFPLQQITNPVGRVMIPFLSRTLDRPGRYRHGYLTCVTGIMILSQPAILFAVIYSDDVLLALLGPRWSATAPIFSWLGIIGLHQVVTATLSWLLVSQGRGRDLFLSSAFGCAIALAAFVIGLSDGAFGVARAYAIADLGLRMPLLWWMATRSGPVGLRDLLYSVWPHALAIAIAGTCLVAAERLVGGSSPVALILLFVASYVVYVATLMCVRPKSELIIDQVSKNFNALRRSGSS